jgi:hypothetical protein
MSSDSDSSTSTVDGVALSQEMMDEDLIELCNKHEIRAEVFNFFHYENVNSLEDLAMYFEDKVQCLKILFCNKIFPDLLNVSYLCLFCNF